MRQATTPDAVSPWSVIAALVVVTTMMLTLVESSAAFDFTTN